MTIIDDLKRSIEFQIGDAEDREEFIRRVGQKLLADLQKYPESKEKETLIEFLMDKGIFPTFAFPLDVAKFEAKGTRGRSKGAFSQNLTSMQQHLKIFGWPSPNIHLGGVWSSTNRHSWSKVWVCLVQITRYIISRSTTSSCLISRTWRLLNTQRTGSSSIVAFQKIVVSSSKPRRLVSISREMWFVPDRGRKINRMKSNPLVFIPPKFSGP